MYLYRLSEIGSDRQVDTRVSRLVGRKGAGSNALTLVISMNGTDL